MTAHLEILIRLGGMMQLGILIASALVPRVLDWRRELAGLATLTRQLVWVHGLFIDGERFNRLCVLGGECAAKCDDDSADSEPDETGRSTRGDCWMTLPRNPVSLRNLVSHGIAVATTSPARTVRYGSTTRPGGPTCRSDPRP